MQQPQIARRLVADTEGYNNNHSSSTSSSPASKHNMVAFGGSSSEGDSSSSSVWLALEQLFPGPIHYKLDTESKRERNVPAFLNPFTPETVALPMSYFDVGISMTLMVTPLSYYLISTLDVSSTSYSAYGTLIGLPWSLKFIFGMISDQNPIFSYRRKSWMLIGWTIFVIIAFAMSLVEEPSFAGVVVSMLFMTCAYLLADVCADASCVERARFETEKRKGNLQTSVYTIRSFASMIGSLLGAILYNTSDWGWGLTIPQLYFISGVVPLMGVIFFMWPLEEIEVVKHAPSFKDQWVAVWETIQKWAVLRPVTFVFIYGCLQIPNQAWTNFLVLGLGFSDFDIGMITVAAAVLYYLGMLAYRQFFFETSWRMIYVYTTLLGGVFSFLQIMLVLGVNRTMGIPDFYFALGDTAIAQLIGGVQFMPSCIIFVMLCPEGCEGVTYALLTTISNLSGSVASDIGSAFTLIWDVDNSTYVKNVDIICIFFIICVLLLFLQDRGWRLFWHIVFDDSNQLSPTVRPSVLAYSPRH
jgi:MFS family permease